MQSCDAGRLRGIAVFGMTTKAVKIRSDVLVALSMLVYSIIVTSFSISSIIFVKHVDPLL